MTAIYTALTLTVFLAAVLTLSKRPFSLSSFFWWLVRIPLGVLAMAVMVATVLLLVPIVIAGIALLLALVVGFILYVIVFF